MTDSAGHFILAELTKRELLGRIGSDFHIVPGRPLPLGVSETAKGLNFSVFTSNGTAVTLALFAPGEHESVLEVALDGDVNRTGHIWHVELQGLRDDTRYGWRVDRQPVPVDRFHRFDPSLVLIDPYARAVTGSSEWGVPYVRNGQAASDFASRRSLCVGSDFDWQYVRPPALPMEDKVIYEMHVRGFTRHGSSGVSRPGTYLGLIEKIPYLKDLGVTTVELLPVYEFDENETRRFNPFTGEFLRNFWGYSPICFFAPKASYAVNSNDGGQVDEFKTLVREFHRAGLEVFLDVVFNHTAEGEGRPGDPTFSFRGLDNRIYYLIDPATGKYLDYSGCGNTLNCNHPVVRELVLNALRYWVAEMHIDGFRFDLASILGRGQNGEVLANPPLLERIAADPILADVTVIAEAWDASGLYQVGSFPSWGRWAEWNGAFRDDVRRFVRGEAGFTGRLATRLAGSSDLYETSGRYPTHSINYVTAHDGFTLADLVAYNHKHNLANGESNRDGSDVNFSWNCGVEGPTDDPAVRNLRARQVRNFFTVLLLSQGVPMILGGDELGRTQQGNNNAYCQDNEISWLDWTLLEENPALHRFVKGLLAFRREHAQIRRSRFLTGAEVTWHGSRLHQPDWGEGSRLLAMHLHGEQQIYAAFNNGGSPAEFELPPEIVWGGVVDTAAPPPADFVRDPRPLSGPTVEVAPMSCRVLRGLP
jgi:glycogen operon protein